MPERARRPRRELRPRRRRRLGPPGPGRRLASRSASTCTSSSCSASRAAGAWRGAAGNARRERAFAGSLRADRPRRRRDGGRDERARARTSRARHRAPCAPTAAGASTATRSSARCRRRRPSLLTVGALRRRRRRRALRLRRGPRRRARRDASTTTGTRSACAPRAATRSPSTASSCRPRALRGGFPAGEPVPYLERNLPSGLFHASASLGIAEAAFARRGAVRSGSATTRARGCSSPSARSTSRPRAPRSRARRALIDEHHAANPTGDGTDEEIVALFAEGQAAKTFVNEAATRVVDRALALSGGAGYLNGSPLARAYRDVRAGAFMHPLGANRAYEFLARRRPRPAARAALSVHVETDHHRGRPGRPRAEPPASPPPGHGHVVLERGRVGERWRSERWESLQPADAQLAQPPAGRAAARPTRTATSTARRDRAPRARTPRRRRCASARPCVGVRPHGRTATSSHRRAATGTRATS